MGRNATGVKRQIQIATRWNKQEAKGLHRMARARKMSVSKYLRSLVESDAQTPLPSPR